MSNRTKNSCILAVLIVSLLMIKLIPVICIFKQVTGINCPACGMTRAFNSILSLRFVDAINLNILSIPLFIFITFSIVILIYEIILNKFVYISKLLDFLSNKLFILILFSCIFLSFILNNIFLSPITL